MVDALRLTAKTDRHEHWGGPRRWFHVFVYDDREVLLKAAKRYSSSSWDWEDTLACWHPAYTRERHVEGRGWVNVSDPHYAGTMRLCREALDSEIIGHECVHAAASIYRMDVKSRISLGDECGPREETFAYIVGDVLGSVAGALFDADVWKTDP